MKIENGKMKTGSVRLSRYCASFLHFKTYAYLPEPIVGLDSILLQTSNETVEKSFSENWLSGRTRF